MKRDEILTLCKKADIKPPDEHEYSDSEHIIKSPVTLLQSGAGKLHLGVVKNIEPDGTNVMFFYGRKKLEKKYHRWHTTADQGDIVIAGLTDDVIKGRLDINGLKMLYLTLPSHLTLGGILRAVGASREKRRGTHVPSYMDYQPLIKPIKLVEILMAFLERTDKLGGMTKGMFNDMCSLKEWDSYTTSERLIELLMENNFIKKKKGMIYKKQSAYETTEKGSEALEYFQKNKRPSEEILLLALGEK